MRVFALVMVMAGTAHAEQPITFDVRAGAVWTTQPFPDQDTKHAGISVGGTIAYRRHPNAAFGVRLGVSELKREWESSGYVSVNTYSTIFVGSGVVFSNRYVWITPWFGAARSTANDRNYAAVLSPDLTIAMGVDAGVTLYRRARHSADAYAQVQYLDTHDDVTVYGFGVAYRFY